MNIVHMDHLVLTVRNMDLTCRFYEQVLGMSVVTLARDEKPFSLGSRNSIYTNMDKNSSQRPLSGPPVQLICV